MMTPAWMDRCDGADRLPDLWAHYRAFVDEYDESNRSDAELTEQVTHERLLQSAIARAKPTGARDLAVQARLVVELIDAGDSAAARKLATKVAKQLELMAGGAR